ncbi:methylated-DNA--[protein]-cysteine S-methyltransferase [Lutimonas zeaxanthinifaciens]|uniref:methylated-DNA--[protein]-cysteine S-methyltransferase n=1 Tax=Lutimonas zeaxanthinifaciens TaxID=3060215 RepID=UPI00265CA254|nr:methylated-DNA--[protein]-cysteine S-methyltransferase [Lutimonas sp. YSD2104]WKK66902.1 methylated-DNA--[protein]-cysteine S-methyltransferase [Lutimonas sp. YSD2104]
MNSYETAYIKTPLGIARIVGNQEGISEVSVLEEKLPVTENPSQVLMECIQQLNEYFSGERKRFTIRLNPAGTAFQKKVWEELLTIPYGKTSTYMKQTMKLGDKKAIRAVASANGKNPIWVIVPCHRVVGKDGALTGYAGGLWRKKWLLEHESPSRQTSLF